MTTLEDTPSSVRRAVVGGIALYFAVVLYATIAEEPAARVVGEALFGVVSIGVGALLYRYDDETGIDSPTTWAGSLLVGGGLVQLAFVATGNLALDLLATGAVFGGVVCYLYVAWTA